MNDVFFTHVFYNSEWNKCSKDIHYIRIRMMMIFCFVLVLLQGTLSASFPETHYSGKVLKSVSNRFLKRSNGLSAEFENVDEARDEIPQNEIENRNVGYAYRPAFYAYLSQSRCYHNDQIVRFNRVWLNNGNSYNVNSGVFVAKESGLYAFTWTVTAHKGTWFIAELRVNSYMRGRVMSDSDLSGPASGIHPATGFAVLYVRRGDHVFIRYVSGSGCTLESDGYTLATFSGWKLGRTPRLLK